MPAIAGPGPWLSTCCPVSPWLPAPCWPTLPLPLVTGAVPVLLGLACSSMIYVAVADLIPGLHRRTRLRETVEQILLIAAGVLSIGGVHHVIEHSGLV
jgi:zinc transporter ZupT